MNALTKVGQTRQLLEPVNSKSYKRIVNCKELLSFFLFSDPERKLIYEKYARFLILFYFVRITFQ